jgi:ApbE superfamily uncharacterized protein (UPF0280 family)
MPAARHGNAFVDAMYESRIYRSWTAAGDLKSFSVVCRETDLSITASSNLEKEALEAIYKYRKPLERYIEDEPPFLYALKSYPVATDAPPIVKQMARAAAATGVGPMAAVAGAIAEFVGKELLRYTPQVIVENGGDIFLQMSKICRIGIYAGDQSLFTNTIALEVHPDDMPLGVCTSSGVVGHSLSMGSSDAVVVLSPSTALADAAATALGNRIRTAEDITSAIDYAQTITGITGVLIIKDDRMGLWGNVKIISLE